ncbi:MAG: pyridoxine 5-phosphate synthase [Gammaproteobacteria bacterium]|jgi:pyridoxine 5-phosphate synthase|nr:pyridoxine 5-phosphate synthase [Gammaproteobacteria bacterium]
MVTKLSVNINKLATLRNARGKNNPDVLKTTLDIISYGAQGITVHPRPDERHIRRKDVYEIASAISVELNIEGYPDKKFLELVKEIKPTQCTLVPDPPHVLTSNAGWSIEKNSVFLQKTVEELHELGIRTALFLDPYNFSDKEREMLPLIGTDRVELYTEKYAETYGTSQSPEVLAVYKNTAMMIHQLGIELNAGHDLDLANLRLFVKEIPVIKEVSIGHALICDALQYGLKETVRRYLGCVGD